MNIEEQKIRETDKYGDIVQSGFCWKEVRSNRTEIYNDWSYVMFYCSTIIFFGTFAKISGFNSPVAELLTYLSPIAVVCLVILLPPFYRQFYLHTGIKFSIDGSIYFIVPPNWQPRGVYVPNWQKSKFHLKDITSIEMHFIPTQSGGRYRIKFDGDDLDFLACGSIIYFSSGEIWRAARNIDEDDARIVTVQLNQALREIRQAMAHRL